MSIDHRKDNKLPTHAYWASIGSEKFVNAIEKKTPSSIKEESWHDNN